MGNGKRNVLQVVDARTANPDIVLHCLDTFQYNVDARRTFTARPTEPKRRKLVLRVRSSVRDKLSKVRNLVF